MKFSKVNTRFINKIKRYLNEINVPFIELGETKNLVVLRASGIHHYLFIHFYNMPEKTMENFKYFNVKVAYPINLDQLVESIKKYINEDYSR